MTYKMSKEIYEKTKQQMEKQKKIYCGSGKKKSDTWLSVTINPDKIQEYIKEYEGNKFIKLNINILSEPDKYGKDVSVSVDTFEPQQKTKDLPF